MPRRRTPLQAAITASILATLCCADTVEADRNTARYVRQKLGLGAKGKLKNRYVIMRHGHSKAMEQGRVGDFDSPLTPDGEQGVIDAMTRARQKLRLSQTTTVIVSSKVERALQTAEIAWEVTGAEFFHKREGLNERHYGNQHDKGNKNIRIPMNWAIDLLVHRPMAWISSRVKPRKRDLPFTGAQSAFAVLDRTLEVIKEMEGKYQGKDIILVSHLDPLFILERAFKGRAPEGLPIPYVHAAQIRAIDLR
jgi:broad specificity phosphatase PhoE